MSYCTFKYTVVYQDGETVTGWSPCKDLSTAKTSLRGFVEAHFLKDKGVKDIDIFDVLHIENEIVWLHHVSKTLEFRYLCDKRIFEYI